MVRPWQEMAALITVAIAHLLSLSPSSAVHVVPADLLNANQVPRSYAYALSAAGPGVEAMGGIKTFSPLNASEANAVIEHAYHTIGVQAVRPCDEALGAFDIQCMFPVHSLENLPDPEDDASWRWDASDVAFLSILRSGFAPLLKILAPRWVSGKRAGFSYVNSSHPDSSEPQYVVNRTGWPEAYNCTPWAALSPVLTKLGAALARRIVSRYNNETHWRQLVPTLKGPPLERETYANGEAPLPLAGVVISNELNTLTCGPPFQCDNSCNKTQWTKQCGGEPYTWNSGLFWDGTKQQAWELIASAAHAVKTSAPNVFVGGPEITLGPAGGPRWNKEEWVAGLLNVLAKSECGGNCLDFWSFHNYPVETRPDQEYSMANEIQLQRRLLNNTPFASLPFAVTEYNAQFAFPGTGFCSSAQGAIINAISLIAMARDPLMLGAFLYVGVDGPFQPRDPLSFPLKCTPSWKYNKMLNCTADAELLQSPVPQCFDFSGRYDHDDCSTAPTFNAFGPSGIGAVGINGEMKPMGVVMAEFFRPLVGKQVLSDHGRPILTTAWTEVFAVIDDDSTCDAPDGRSSVKLLAAAFNFSDPDGKPLATVASTSDCVDCVSQPASIASYLPWMSAEQANKAELRSLSMLSQNVSGTALSYPVGDAPIFTSLVQLVGAVVQHNVGNGSAVSYLQGAYLGEVNQLTLAMLSVPGCVDGRPSCNDKKNCIVNEDGVGEEDNDEEDDNKDNTQKKRKNSKNSKKGKK